MSFTRYRGTMGPRLQFASLRSPIRALAPLLSMFLVGQFSALTVARADPQVDWRQVATSGPSPRATLSMAYDSARGKTVLFGGLFVDSSWTFTYYNDTWEWDGNQWKQVATTGPIARRYASMAYDSARGKTVLFGGESASGLVGDTWEWDGNQWKEVATSGPSPRWAMVMAYDSARGKTVLFGGSASNLLGDTWEWDGDKWQQATSPGPTARYGSVMAYDSSRGRTVLFGGYDIATGNVSDTWEWDGSRWEKRATAGPKARLWATMAYDSARATTVLFGGWSPAGCLGDTWEWDGSQWKQATANVPGLLNAAATAFDSARATTVLFGGFNSDSYPRYPYFDDTWEYGPLNVTRPFSLADAAHAIQAAAGLAVLSQADRARCDVETSGASAGCVDMLDVLRIARKVAGLEANP